MDTRSRYLGRSLRLTRWATDAIEGLEGVIEQALADPANVSLRHAARGLLAELGHDASALDDLELRRLVRELIEDRRLSVLDDGSAALLLGSEEQGEDDDEDDDDDPPGPDEPAKQQQKYKLVELVEVVDRGGLGTVGGAAKDSAKLPKHLDRTEKDGAAYKQFINLGRDIDGAANRHPENGRDVDLRARIEWTSGDKTKSLSGKSIKWKLVAVNHPGAGRPASFAVDAEKSGLGGANDELEKTSSTDADGWASIRLHLSQYAGDQLSVTAEVDTADGEAVSGAALKAGPYAVWRKFWYQTTKRDGSPVPAPADSISAYAAICADMLAADEVLFKKTDAPPPPDRTFYPEGMTTTGSASVTDFALIGGHNRDWFWGKYNAEATKPVKGHLIICDGQWDPIDVSAVQVFDMPARTHELTIDIGGSWNAGILKPALEGDVLDSAKWRIKASMKAKYDAADAAGTPDPTLPAKPADWEGDLSDADIDIPLPRTALNNITVTLPAACPDPTQYEIEVVIKAAYGKFFGGESVDINMLIAYTPGEDPAYYQCVSHEFGHGFKQVPDKKNSDSLPDHATQYDDADGHGGQGSHCSTGSTADAPDATFTGGLFHDGTCIMFHQLSPSTCTQTFCATCEPHLRLQSFDSL